MKVFAGCSAEDYPIAEHFTSKLESEGHEIVGDLSRMPPDDCIQASIVRAIDAADVVIVFLSTNLLNEADYDDLLDTIASNIASTELLVIRLDASEIPAPLRRGRLFDYQSTSDRILEEVAAYLRPAISVQDNKSLPRMVLLIHGINTAAQWTGPVSTALREAGFDPRPVGYGKYSVWQFLSPFSHSRDKAVERVVQSIETAQKAYGQRYHTRPDKMSVIAHSFGTYIWADILRRYGYKWDRVIICGSVLRSTHDFSNDVEKFTADILSETGTKDYWPAIAESVGWVYGSVGSDGFPCGCVQVRWHADYRHSSFLTKSFCTEHWVPFLRNQRISDGDEPGRLPWWVQALRFFRLRFVLLAIRGLVFLVMLYLGYVCARLLWSINWSKFIFW